MKTLGMNIDIADENQLRQALLEAGFMPWYPDANCVRRIDDFIVVRISEILYE